jgi:iron complex transport system substrate-binding protein
MSVAWRARRAPERIVCLTEEPTEILYALGEQERIVGISAYTVRPAEARRDKPVVSAFIGGSVKKIAALEPDLVIGFSDIQAQLAHDLIKANLPVLIFNQRTIQEIFDVIMTVGRLVDRGAEAAALVAGYIEGLEAARERGAARAARFGRAPKVYFEEWDEPLICGSTWVSELIEVAGGEALFAERSRGRLARERFVTHDEIIASAPELILASWCGKAVDVSSILLRPGYESVPAIQHKQVVEIDSSIILQPGPASVTEGLAAVERALDGVVFEGR